MILPYVPTLCQISSRTITFGKDILPVLQKSRPRSSPTDGSIRESECQRLQCSVLYATCHQMVPHLVMCTEARQRAACW